MKFLFCVFTLLSIQLISTAQSADTTVIQPQKCYDEYKALFEKQGVYELEDGLHKTIVTFRLNGVCTSYEGQARIDHGKFKLPLLIKNEQGKLVTIKSTGRNLNKNYDAYRIPLENKVIKGASPTYISDRDELMDVFLIDLLRPEAK